MKKKKKKPKKKRRVKVLVSAKEERRKSKGFGLLFISDGVESLWFCFFCKSFRGVVGVVI